MDYQSSTGNKRFHSIINDEIWVFAYYGVRIVVNNGKEALRITALQGATALLHAPTPGKKMVPRMKNSVTATVAVQLRELTGRVFFEGESRFGGIPRFCRRLKAD